MTIFAKRRAAKRVIFLLMQATLTNWERPRPKEAELPDENRKSRKTPVDQASGMQDCTLEGLGRRCNTKTAVLKRILHFPLFL